MANKSVKCGKLNISNTGPFTLIAGPCQLENEKHALDIAGELKKITDNLGIGLIYKTSFDKANRTSLNGKRGAGLEKSLPIFDKIRKQIGVPVLTDIHTIDQCALVSKHVDVLQIPAFLCRQTDLLVAAAKTGKVIIVYEDNLTNGPGAEIAAKISDNFFELLDGPVSRVAAKDSPVPFNWFLEEKILPQTEDIAESIEELMEY